MTCNFQISHYDSNISKAFCNPSLLSDKITVSSAYNITSNLYYTCNSFSNLSLIFSNGIPLIDKNSLQARSFKKIEKRKGCILFTLTYTCRTRDKSDWQPLYWFLVYIYWTLNRQSKKKREKLTGHTWRTLFATIKIWTQHKNRTNFEITLKTQEKTTLEFLPSEEKMVFWLTTQKKKAEILIEQ